MYEELTVNGEQALIDPWKQPLAGPLVVKVPVGSEEEAYLVSLTLVSWHAVIASDVRTAFAYVALLDSEDKLQQWTSETIDGHSEVESAFHGYLWVVIDVAASSDRAVLVHQVDVRSVAH